MRPPEMRRSNGQRFRMEGSNCPACKIVHFPPRDVCPDCGEEGKEAKVQGREVVIYQRNFFPLCGKKLF